MRRSLVFRNTIAMFLIVIISFSMSFVCFAGVLTRGAGDAFGTWSYRNDNGTVPGDGWIEDNGKWRYLTSFHMDDEDPDSPEIDGAVLYNAVTPDGFYVDKNGEYIPTTEQGNTSDIVGTWIGPYYDGTATLTIKSDGTAMLVEKYDDSYSATYNGNIHWCTGAVFALLDSKNENTDGMFKYENGVMVYDAGIIEKAEGSTEWIWKESTMVKQ